MTTKSTFTFARNVSLEQKDVPANLKKLLGAVKIPKKLDHKKEIRKIMSSKDRMKSSGTKSHRYV